MRGRNPDLSLELLAEEQAFDQSVHYDALLRRVQELKPIASDLGLSMAQLAIAWVLANPNVSAALVGATRPAQLEDNVKASGVTLGADVLARIDEVLGDAIERDPAKTVSPEFVRAGTRLAVLEMIQSGTTAYADMYYFEEEIAKATREAGLRGVLGQTIIQFPVADARNPAEGLARTEALASAADFRVWA